MKWLFAILVALNIAVFAGMVSYRISERDIEARRTLNERNSLSMRELGVPDAARQIQASSAPEWIQNSASQAITEDMAQASMVELDKTDEEKALEKAAKEKAERERLAREKKAREEKEAKAQLAKAQNEQSEQQEREELTRLARETGLLPPASVAAQMESRRKAIAPAPSKQCSLTGRVTIPEDDYHRLKGLLNHWPNSVSRTVTRRSGNPTAATQYQVWIAASGDPDAQQAELAQKGFQGALIGGRFSIGSFKSQSAAKALLAKINQSGISGASITENVDQNAADNSLSIAKMDVFFTSLNEQDFKEIQQVVGKYGQLQRGACR